MAWYDIIDLLTAFKGVKYTSFDISETLGVRNSSVTNQLKKLRKPCYKFFKYEYVWNKKKKIYEYLYWT